MMINPKKTESMVVGGLASVRPVAIWLPGLGDSLALVFKVITLQVGT